MERPESPLDVESAGSSRADADQRCAAGVDHRREPCPPCRRTIGFSTTQVTLDASTAAATRTATTLTFHVGTSAASSSSPGSRYDGAPPRSQVTHEAVTSRLPVARHASPTARSSRTACARPTSTWRAHPRDSCAASGLRLAPGRARLPPDRTVQRETRPVAPNPFLDRRLNVTFTDARTAPRPMVPGFFDGDGQRARRDRQTSGASGSLLTQAGVWSYVHELPYGTATLPSRSVSIRWTGTDPRDSLDGASGVLRRPSRQRRAGRGSPRRRDASSTWDEHYLKQRDGTILHQDGNQQPGELFCLRGIRRRGEPRWRGHRSRIRSPPRRLATGRP